MRVDPLLARSLLILVAGLVLLLLRAFERRLGGAR